MKRTGGGLVAERLTVTLLSAPLESPVRMSFSQLNARQVCLVEIEASGFVGVGETWINYPPWGAQERLATLTEGVAPLLLGLDVSSPPAVLEQLSAAMLPIARQWGAPGPIWQALSGIDLALWDLAGKAANTSVASLLKPDRVPTERVPAYASGVGPDTVVELCESAMEQGFRAVKTKVGFGHERDTDIVSKARFTIGEEMKLFADANQAWGLEEATAFCKSIAKYRVDWLEEPVAGDRVKDLLALTSQTGMALASGENIYGIDTFAKYLESGALHIVQPDLTKSGGITIGHRIAERAAAAKTDVAPHCYGGAVGIAAALQLADANEGFAWVELDIRSNPLREDLLQVPFEFSHGGLRVPAGAGLGIELNQETLHRYMIHREERTYRDFR